MSSLDPDRQEIRSGEALGGSSLIDNLKENTGNANIYEIGLNNIYQFPNTINVYKWVLI
jgi:hypothetical protein